MRLKTCAYSILCFAVLLSLVATQEIGFCRPCPFKPPPNPSGVIEGIGNNTGGGMGSNVDISDPTNTSDSQDKCPNAPEKTAPGICGCGYPDTDSDFDGVADCIDKCPKDARKIKPGVCGCGIEDVDTDGDGTPDCNDQCKNDPNKTEPGLCGCGVKDTDTDKDGTPDCNDQCKDDPNKTDPGECGCGIPDTDANANGVADCKEPKKSGCVSDNECPQGYVCNSQSGQCVSPFDESHGSSTDLLAQRDDQRNQDNVRQAITDHGANTKRDGFTSDDLDKNIDDTQTFVGTECNDRKPCPAGQTCKDGKCVDKHADCSKDEDCPKDHECKDGKCVKKSGTKPKSLAISPANKAVKINEPVSLKAILKDEDGTTKDVTQKATWSPGNPFSKGEIGQYTVKATYENLSGSAMITVVKEKGMDDISVNSKTITVTFFDHGKEDGDMIDILINGKAVFSGIRLTKAPQSRTITMNADIVVFGFRALNVGKIPPNTATVTFSSVVKGKSRQQYQLSKNQKTNMNITYTPK